MLDTPWRVTSTCNGSRRVETADEDEENEDDDDQKVVNGDGVDEDNDADDDDDDDNNYDDDPDGDDADEVDSDHDDVLKPIFPTLRVVSCGASCDIVWWTSGTKVFLPTSSKILSRCRQL